MTGTIGSSPTDLVVVVPGILGSRLAQLDPKGYSTELWGTSVATIVKNLLSFGKRVRALGIAEDVDPDDPQDGIVPTGLVNDLAIIPGLVGITGYDGLLRALRRDLGLVEGQLVPFAYDWRLSNRINGRLLARFLEEHVARWRRRSGNPTVKAIIVAHSMGGLVSRWALEKEGCHEFISRLVTLGTPYRGAANALDALANGLRIPRRVGPQLDDLVQSLPSVRELLPVYACVRTPGASDLKYLHEVGVLPTSWVDSGRRFHSELAAAVAQRTPTRTDTLEVILGSRQPTLTTARVDQDGSLRMLESIDGTSDGPDYRGDGTVPSDSASPPEWSPDQVKSASVFAQSHGSIQDSTQAHLQLGWLLADRPRMKAEAADLGLRCPSAVLAGATFEIWIDGPPNLGLVVNMHSADDGSSHSLNVVKADGRYKATVRNLRPGLYVVMAARRDRRAAPVHEVSSLLVAYTEE